VNMASGQVSKRVKFKSSVKDPGTPGRLFLVPFTTFPFWVFDFIIKFWNLIALIIFFGFGADFGEVDVQT